MKKLILMVGLTVVAIACGSAGDMMMEIMDAGVPDAGADPGDGSTMKFVGGSSAAPAGGSSPGLFDLYDACHDTFGKDHRACTSIEITNTADYPTLVDGELYVFLPQLSSPALCSYYIDHRGRVDSGNVCNIALGRVACCGPK